MARNDELIRGENISRLVVDVVLWMVVEMIKKVVVSWVSW